MLEFRKRALISQFSTLQSEQLVELDGVDTYLKQILDDVQSLNDAEYELSYRCYDTYSMISDELSDAYEALGRVVYQRLKEAEVYEGNLLRFSFHRLLGNDVVLIRIDL